MFFKKKFDLVISLGEDCACSSYLRRFNLQEYSYPFDWLTRAKLMTRVDLLANDFEGFLEKENVHPIEKPAGNVDENADYYEDRKTDFYFYHDFPAGMPFEESYAKVKAKYDRRIKRMYDLIFKSKSVLFVWWSRDKHTSSDEAATCFKKLKNKFKGKDVYMLVVEYEKTPTEQYLENNHLLISRFDNISYKQNPKWTETMGNESNNIRLFEKIRKKRSLKQNIGIMLFFVLKFFVSLLPNKKLRHAYKKKLRIKFYNAKL